MMVRSLWLSLLFCSASFILAASPDNFYNDDKNIIEATSRSFDRIVHRSNYTSLVEFYAPWCGHCKNLAPTMKKVAKKLDGLVQVVTVNCDLESNKPLCGEYEVKGFPTLKVFKPQKFDLLKDDTNSSKKVKKVKGTLTRHVFEDYIGERKMSTIVDFCISRIKNHVKKVGNVNKFHKLDNLPLNRKPIIVFSKNDRISPVLKSMGLDWLDTVQFFSIYNKKVTLLPEDSDFNKKYPQIVTQLNEIIESIKKDPSKTHMIAFDFTNDKIIEYRGKSINKEGVNDFLTSEFELKSSEGPFSNRGEYLNRLKSGKKPVKNNKNKNNSNKPPGGGNWQKVPKNNKTKKSGKKQSNSHDEL